MVDGLWDTEVVRHVVGCGFGTPREMIPYVTVRDSPMNTIICQIAAGFRKGEDKPARADSDAGVRCDDGRRDVELAGCRSQWVQGALRGPHLLRVPDYKRTRDFYADLMGLRVTDDTGTQCQLRFGDSAITARNLRAQPNEPVDSNPKPTVDHIAYRIADWDTDTVKAELEHRGLQPRLDAGDASSPPNYASFHMKDPDGYDVQISGIMKPGY